MFTTPGATKASGSHPASMRDLESGPGKRVGDGGALIAERYTFGPVNWATEARSYPTGHCQ